MTGTTCQKISPVILLVRSPVMVITSPSCMPRGGGGGGVGGGKTPIFLRHFDFFGLPRKVRTNHPSYPPRNGSETPCDPKIHAKGDSEYEKMQKNSEKVAF